MYATAQQGKFHSAASGPQEESGKRLFYHGYCVVIVERKRKYYWLRKYLSTDMLQNCVYIFWLYTVTHTSGT